MSLVDRFKEITIGATRDELQQLLSAVVEEVLRFGQAEVLVFGNDSKELIGSVLTPSARSNLLAEHSADSKPGLPSLSDVAEFYNQLESEMNQPEN